MTDLATRLHDLADLIETGSVPAAAVAGLEAVLARAERNAWLAIAAGHCGGPAGLQRLVAGQAWRIRVWLQRGRTPAQADPALVAVYNAVECGGPLPCERQLRRICGHGLSDHPADTGSTYQESPP